MKNSPDIVFCLLLEAKADFWLKAKSGATTLHFAVVPPMTACASLLVAKGLNVNSQTRKGNTPLHTLVRAFSPKKRRKMAVGAEDDMVHILKCLSMLLDKGADPYIKNHKQQTPIHVASKLGNVESLNLLLNRPQKLQFPGGEEPTTPLQCAARAGSTVCVELLLSKNCDVDVTDVNGATALHTAAAYGRSAVLELLIAKGANIDKKNVLGQTAVMLAAKGAHRSSLCLLLDKGARLDMKDTGGDTAIHYACRGGESEIVLQLLARGMQPAAAGYRRWTPLHHAAYHGFDVCVSHLLQAICSSASGSNTSLVNSSSQDGHTALHLAAAQGHCRCLVLLLDKGADIAAKDSKGKTALHHCSVRNSCECLELLANKHASLTATTLLGESALHLASFSGSHDVVVELLTREEKLVDASRHDGWTPLHLAVSQGLLAAQELRVPLAIGSSRTSASDSVHVPSSAFCVVCYCI